MKTRLTAIVEACADYVNTVSQSLSVCEKRVVFLIGVMLGGLL